MWVNAESRHNVLYSVRGNVVGHHVVMEGLGAAEGGLRTAVRGSKSSRHLEFHIAAGREAL